MDGASTPPVEVDDAPRWARRFVVVFLLAFGLAGLAGIEAWPLTGWRLFADLRHGHQVTVRAFVVAPDGAERGLPFWRLPPTHRGAVQVLQGFADLAGGEREAVCEAWASALEALRVEVAAIRVYRVEWDLTEREGGRAAPATDRTLLASCAEGSP